MDISTIKNTKEFAKGIRIAALKMVHASQGSHLGGALSMADVLAVLYNGVLRVSPSSPNDPSRDRFILSKGHACSTLYAALAKKGFFPESLLGDYCKDGSPLPGHVTKSSLPGIELSTGSLGHGLPVACGMALAAKRDGNPARIFVLIGDGECDEGSNWEAFLFACHHALDNLTVIIDANGIQSLGDVSEVLNIEPLEAKLKAFNWPVKRVNGHDIGALMAVFNMLPFEKGKPSCIIADTVKGKGVSFMEKKLLWHYKSPSDQELQTAVSELEDA